MEERRELSPGSTRRLLPIPNHRRTKTNETREKHANEGRHHRDESSAEWGRMWPTAASATLPTWRKHDLDYTTRGTSVTHRLQEVYTVEEYTRQMSTRCLD